MVTLRQVSTTRCVVSTLIWVLGIVALMEAPKWRRQIDAVGAARRVY